MDNFFIFRRPKSRETESTTNEASGASYEERAVSVYTVDTALTVAAFHRAVELRAKTMGQMLLQYQKRKAIGGNYEMDMYGQGKVLNYLLQVRPNFLMTASVMMEQIEIRKITEGNAFVYIERNDGGEVTALWLADFGTYNQVSNEYQLTFNGRGGTKTIVTAAHNVIHLPNTYRDLGGYMGIPTLSFMARTLSIAATNDQSALETAAKGGKQKLLLQEKETSFAGIGGRASKKELDKIANRINDEVYTKDVIRVPNIVGVTPISQNAQQMELLESRKFAVRDISRYLGVPPVLLMDDSNSSYKTPEAATQEFMLRTIQPEVRELEDEFNSKMLNFSDFGQRRIHACEKPLLRLDMKGQAEIDKLHLETGVNSVNELRSQYDLPTVKGGDTHYISTNLAELGSDKLRGGEASAPTPQPIQNEEGGEE